MNPALLEIPGYAEALKRERDVRDVGVLNVNTRICGVEVRQMTLRDWLVLDAVDCELLKGNAPTTEELVRFLWYLSPEYKPHSDFALWRFKRRIRKLPYGRCAYEAIKFVEDTFLEPPMVTQSGDDEWTTPQVSFAAQLVHSLAGYYHWPKEQIMGMAVKEIFQYMKLIRMTREAMNGKSPIMFNPSDAVKMKAIQERRKLTQSAAFQPN